MSDISMCQNKDCELSSQCYRFTAVASEYWQSYSDFKPELGDEGAVVCDNFIDNSSRGNVK